MNDKAAEAQKPGSSSTRTFILLGVLGAAVALLLFDKMVNVPGVKAAFDQVEARNTEINASSERRAMTNLDVQEVLGREPIATEKENSYVVEVYNLSKIPLLARKYYASYKPGEGDKLIFVSHALLRDDLTLTNPNTPAAVQPAGADASGPSTAMDDEATKAAASESADEHAEGDDEEASEEAPEGADGVTEEATEVTEESTP